MGKLNQKESTAVGQRPCARERCWLVQLLYTASGFNPYLCNVPSVLARGHRTVTAVPTTPRQHQASETVEVQVISHELHSHSPAEETRDTDFYCPQGRKHRAAGPCSIPHLSPAISSLLGTECLSLNRKEDADSHLTGWWGG